MHTVWGYDPRLSSAKLSETLYIPSHFWSEHSILFTCHRLASSYPCNLWGLSRNQYNVFQICLRQIQALYLFKPLFFFRIFILPKDSQIAETMPVPSSRVKDDLFLTGHSGLSILICFHIRLILLISNTIK